MERCTAAGGLARSSKKLVSCCCAWAWFATLRAPSRLWARAIAAITAVRSASCVRLKRDNAFDHQRSSPAAPASAAAPQPAPAAEPSLAGALGELQAQLSAVDQRVDPESSLLSERDRQRYLESQVHAAQQKVEDLRNEFADSNSASGVQARLDVIQHALALFWPSTAGLNTAGTSEEQLDYERNQLTRDMSVIAQQRQAAQREEAANSASVNQPAPAAVAPSPPAPEATGNPLHLERMARLPAQVAWWPSALIGCFCGVLYWGLAFARYHSSSESDDLLDLPKKSATSIYHLSDTDARVPAGSDEVPDDDYRVKTSSPKRAYFIFDPDSIPAPVPGQSPSLEPIQDTTADTVLDIPPETAMVSTDTDMADAASAADTVAPLRAPEGRDEVFPEEIVEMADPWVEAIRINLSQTDVARMLSSQIAAENVAAKGPNRDVAPPPSETDRLAS